MRSLVAGALCLVVIGCQQEQPKAAKKSVPDARNVKVDTVVNQPPIFIDHSVLGSALGPDGTATNPSLTFEQGRPIYLTLFLRESPGGLVTTAVWSDAADKKILLTDRKPMNGGKIATFTWDDPKTKPGRYHVIGYWGGDIGAEYRFEIVSAAKANRKKG
jgi:hypothetical protein